MTDPKLPPIGEVWFRHGEHIVYALAHEYVAPLWYIVGSDKVKYTLRRWNRLATRHETREGGVNKRLRLAPGDRLFDLYVRFHTGQLSIEGRTRAKALLAPIHYSNEYDTNLADKEVLRIFQERKSR